MAGGRRDSRESKLKSAISVSKHAVGDVDDTWPDPAGATAGTMSCHLQVIC